MVFVSVAAKGPGAALVAVPSPLDQRYASIGGWAPSGSQLVCGRLPIVNSHCSLVWEGSPVCIRGGIEDILFGGGSGIITAASMLISFSGCD